MTKKQFVLSAFVAAIPAFLLIAVVVLSLMDSETGILTDGAKPSIALWVAFVGSALGALVMGVLPFAVMIFPGLYPMAAVATAAGPAAGGVPGGSDVDGDDDGVEVGVADDDFGGDDFADEFAEDAEAEEEPAPAAKGKKKK
ncbi:MAG: hypothetical protein ACOVRM_06215 [Planctomycetaceae bacterium]|jgi:hypothetical protein